MNKTEILNIVNEPSKHIQIVKIDGKDSIVYSSKFVELLELIPTMLTKDEVAAMLEEIQLEIKEQLHDNPKEYGQTMYNNGLFNSYVLVQHKINVLKENADANV